MHFRLTVELLQLNKFQQARGAAPAAYTHFLPIATTSQHGFSSTIGKWCSGEVVFAAEAVESYTGFLCSGKMAHCLQNLPELLQDHTPSVGAPG